MATLQASHGNIYVVGKLIEYWHPTCSISKHFMVMQPSKVTVATYTSLKQRTNSWDKD